MARGKPVTLRTMEFAKRGDAGNFFKEMLGRYRPGDRVSDGDSIHLDALLDHHADQLQKRGEGIDHFEVMSADYGTQCFCLVRKNGSREDFSYVHCIANS